MATPRETQPHLHRMPLLNKILIAVAGGALLIAGVAMIVLPGPAFVAIAAALAILAMGFVWAQRCLGGCASGSKHAPQTSRRVSAAGGDALPLTS
jgi:hypothetical protein